MDKAEYQEILDQIQAHVGRKEYQEAYDLAKTVDWNRVKSIRTLNMIADIYEVNKDYEGYKKVLLNARNRASVGKGILYRLVGVCLKLGQVDEAEKYFAEYSAVAGNASEKLLLEYEIAKAKKEPLETQIRLLEEYREREYTERWAYELAVLYSKNGQRDKCVDVCDDMILWFSNGKYVLKAIELKRRYAQLTPSQLEYFSKEQKDSDPRLFTGDVSFASDIMAKAEAAPPPVLETSELVIPEEYRDKEEDEKGSVLERIEAAGAAYAKDVDLQKTSALELSNEEIDKFSVTSPIFMGGKPDLKTQLAQSIEAVYPESEVKAAEEPEITTIPVEEALKEAEEFAAKAKIQADAVPTDETVVIASDKSTNKPEIAFEMADSNLPKKDAPAPTFPADWEIPDPEETEEEKKSHTIPLGKVGQNTVPISVEEIIRSETPEERRIRILNNAKPTKMSDEQRRIFTYFARVPGMDTQILEAVTNVYTHAGEHTSRRGNIAVMGAAGTGKTRLTYGLIVMMCKDMGLDAAKIARLSGEEINGMDPAKVVAKMSGGFLAIEQAGDMNAETVEKLNNAMEFKTDCMILIIEDDKNGIRTLFKKYPDFAEKFTGSIVIPAFTNDELVTFARTYCAENNCELDEMGVLALYTLISNNQTEEEPVSISSVKQMVDGAISHARRAGRKSRKGPKSRKIVLYEKDFMY